MENENNNEIAKYCCEDCEKVIIVDVDGNIVKPGDEIHAKISIDIDDEPKHRKLFEIENAMLEAGITFDTGTMISKDKLTREWEFDWSLEGAKVTFVGKKENN